MGRVQIDGRGEKHTMDHEACCFDSWDYLNERCDVASDWNDIGRYVQGGEACDRSLDFPTVNETRIGMECKLTEKMKGDTTAYDA